MCRSRSPGILDLDFNLLILGSASYRRRGAERLRGGISNNTSALGLRLLVRVAGFMARGGDTVYGWF